jgi:phage baseplate assembly protein W
MSAYPDPLGWPFLPRPQAGGLSYPGMERSVRESIRVILTTRPGEQLMRPRFGVGLQNYLDNGNTIALRSQIQQAILQGLQNYENRITVDAVDVDPVPGDNSQLQINIYYRLLRTNSTQQISVQLKVG